MTRRPTSRGRGATPETATAPPRLGVRLLMAALVAAGVAHIVWLRFLYDDAYITFRYARNLASGLGPVFNPGERVEGYSNFLWMLMMSAVLKVGANPESWSQWLGGGCAIATLIVVMWFAKRHGCGWITAGLLIVLNRSWAAWGTGGLETSLVGVLLTAAVVALMEAMAADPASGESRPAPRAREVVLSAACFGLACLTRPDALLPTAAAGLLFVAWCWRHRTMRWALVWAAVNGLIVVPHVVWRLLYYGRLVPNTFAAKTPGLAAIPHGLAYLGDALLELRLDLLLAVIAIAAIARVPARGLGGSQRALLGLVLVPFAAYIATTGGDFMPAYRYVAPLVPLLALATASSLAGLANALARRRRALARGLVGAVIVAYGAFNVAGSAREQGSWVHGDMVSVGWARAEMADWTAIGELLHRVALPTDTLATTAAGAIPYRSGLVTVDLHGLNAADLSLYRRRDSRRPGHGLQLREQWLIDHPPQILLGHPLVHPTPASLALGVDLDPAWRDRVLAHYELVGMTVPTQPVRYVGCAVRRDAVERLLAASAAGAR